MEDKIVEAIDYVRNKKNQRKNFQFYHKNKHINGSRLTHRTFRIYES